VDTTEQHTRLANGADRTRGPGGGRAALLTAAREELAEVGTGGLSLRSIARRAGVSHAAPKHHFGDRAGLLTALASQGFGQLGDALEHAVATSVGDPRERLAALGRAYVHTGLRDPALFELMFRPDLLDRDDPNLREAQQATFDLLAAVVADAPTDARADGPADARVEAPTDAREPADGPERADGPTADQAGGSDQTDGLGQTAKQTSLIAWAFVHGLVTLTRDGALQAVTAAEGASVEQVVDRLVDLFASRMPGEPAS
jgi:AcrR family transcriptional regulator